MIVHHSAPRSCLVHLVARTRPPHRHPCCHHHVPHTRHQHTVSPPSNPSPPLPSPPASSSSSSDPLSSLTSWVLSSGGLCSKVAPRASPTSGRALYTVQPVRSNETLIRVPRSCLITATSAKASDIGRLMADTGRDIAHRGSFVSAFLLQERTKGAASPFHAYIAALPTRQTAFPVLWPDAILDLLQGSLALPLIRSYQKDIYTGHQRRRQPAYSLGIRIFLLTSSVLVGCADHLTLMLASPAFSLDEWLWARLTVSSRAFGAAIDGVPDELVLVPLIDLINHSLDPNTTWGFDSSTLSFTTVVSRRPLRAGEEVHESYGDKCNSLLLTYYAFTLSDNPHNTCSLRLTLPPSDERTRMRKTNLLHLMHDGLSEVMEFTPTAGYVEEAMRMLSFLRVAYANEGEVGLLLEEEKKEEVEGRKLRVKAGGAKRVRVIGRDNEERVWRTVGMEAKLRLGEFKESEADDERLLQEGRYSAGSSEWHCVVMRKGEKAVLRWWMESSELVLRMLREGILTLMGHEREMDDRGLEEYRVTELSPLLRRWNAGSRRAQFVTA